MILDFFLFNDFQGAVRETTRDLCGELTAALVEKRRPPDINILFIMDPINTIYGGAENPYINQLLAAGIEVITTDLDQLRDSNTLYSFFWRLLARPLGNDTNGLSPTPFSDGKITLRSYLRLFNLKANHRKTLIADDGNNGWTGMVLTGNPHNGSSANRNIALRFTGDAVNDLYISERAVLEMCRHDIPATDLTTTAVKSNCKLQVLTEQKIKLAVLDILDRAKALDAIDMILFYLFDRDVIKAIQRAHNRGVLLRIILDPNKDSFGMRKIGIPNQPVAHDLNEVGVPIRWADTHSKQCHRKLMMYRDPAGPAQLLLGSVNFTRRNLNDFNLETDVLVKGSIDTPHSASVFGYLNDYGTMKRIKNLAPTTSGTQTRGDSVIGSIGLWKQRESQLFRSLWQAQHPIQSSSANLAKVAYSPCQDPRVGFFCTAPSTALHRRASPWWYRF